MLKQSMLFKFVFAVFTLFSFLITTNAVSAGPAGPYASGYGNLITSGSLRTFSFHARELNNGNVTGSLVLKNREMCIRVKAAIDCLDINGNEATMSGIVTQQNGIDDLLGEEVWFRVQDNGEGRINSADKITLLIVELHEAPHPDECTNRTNVPTIMSWIWKIFLAATFR